MPDNEESLKSNLSDTEKLEKQFDQQFELLIEKGESFARNVLLASTALLIGYKLFTLLTESDDEKKTQKKNAFVQKILGMVGREVGLIALNMVKGKIIDYLNEKDIIKSTDEEREDASETTEWKE